MKPFPVKARFIVGYETALRPGLLDKLSVPEHYSKGRDSLTVTDDLDKARFGRELPLSVEARAALDAVAPKQGLIFGDHWYRDQVKKAAKKAVCRSISSAPSRNTTSSTRGSRSFRSRT